MGTTDFIRQTELQRKHPDGTVWSGILVKIFCREGMVCPLLPEYSITTQHNLIDFTRQFTRRTRKIPLITWNGGYHIDYHHSSAGYLDETWYGTPLGLFISKGVMLSPPLFDRPSLLCDKEGNLSIRRINTREGFTFSCRSKSLFFPGESRNPLNSAKELPPLCYYDLTFPGDEIPGDGRVIVSMAGNVIKLIHETRRGETVRVKKTGLTLSLESDLFPATWDLRDKELTLSNASLQDIQTGVEGGPLLIQEGEIAIDTKLEGWQTEESGFLFGADAWDPFARRAGTAAGLDENGNLMILFIRKGEKESAGASLYDIANLLKDEGAVSAMMFSHLSSSLLVSDTEPSSDPGSFIRNLPRHISWSPDPLPVMYSMLAIFPDSVRERTGS